MAQIVRGGIGECGRVDARLRRVSAMTCNAGSHLQTRVPGSLLDYSLSCIRSQYDGIAGPHDCAVTGCPCPCHAGPVPA